MWGEKTNDTVRFWRISAKNNQRLIGAFRDKTDTTVIRKPIRIFPNLVAKSSSWTTETPWRLPHLALPLSSLSLIPASSFQTSRASHQKKQRWRWERAASQSAKKKRPLFMKIYNFAGEVYDSAGLRIGRRRSCGHGGMGTYFPWGYIAAAVFGVAHSLNSCYTNPFLASFFAAPGRASFCPPSSSTSTSTSTGPPPSPKKTWSLRAATGLCAPS